MPHFNTQPLLCRPARFIGQADEEMVVAIIILGTAIARWNSNQRKELSCLEIEKQLEEPKQDAHSPIKTSF